MKRLFQRIGEKARDVRQPPIILTALGDSVTQGAMEHCVYSHEGVYHRQLQREFEALYPITAFSTINAGVSGGTAQQALERLDRDVIKYEPDLLLIAFGLNDSMGGPEGVVDFKVALNEIVGRVQKDTLAEIMLLTPPFMASRRNGKIHPEHEKYTEAIVRSQTMGHLAMYAEAIRDVARQCQVCLADIHAEWARLSREGFDTDCWLSNGLNHPNNEGHKLASTIIWSCLLAHRPPLES